MTTTITVETHAWPVEVETRTYHEHEKGSFFSRQIDLVAPNSKHQVNITQQSKVQFKELPPPDQSVN